MKWSSSTLPTGCNGGSTTDQTRHRRGTKEGGDYLHSSVTSNQPPTPTDGQAKRRISSFATVCRSISSRSKDNHCPWSIGERQYSLGEAKQSRFAHSKHDLVSVRIAILSPCCNVRSQDHRPRARLVHYSTRSFTEAGAHDLWIRCLWARDNRASPTLPSGLST